MPYLSDPKLTKIPFMLCAKMLAKLMFNAAQAEYSMGDRSELVQGRAQRSCHILFQHIGTKEPR